MGYGSKNGRKWCIVTYTVYASNDFLLQNEFSRNTRYMCISKIIGGCAFSDKRLLDNLKLKS